MNAEFENIPIIKNDITKRFELTIDGYTAFIDFKQKDSVIKLIHTESPAELSGRGVAATLVEKTLIYFEENKLELVPLCPYVFAFIKKNPEWKRIVTNEFKEKF